MIRFALQSSRSARDRSTTKHAEGVADPVLLGYRQVLAIEMQVACDKQIQPSIPVIVTPRRTRRPVAQRHPSLLSHVGKGPIMIVAIEPILSPVRDVDIRPAIVVEIGNGHAHAPAIVLNTRVRSHIRERPIVVVVEQSSMRRCLFAVERIEGRPVHDINIEPSIVVIIDQTDSRPLGLHKVGLGRRPHPVCPMSEPGLFRDVFEYHRPALHKSACSDRPPLCIQLGRMGTLSCATRCLLQRDLL